MVQKFRKKPVVIEAIKYEPHSNCMQVAKFMGVEDSFCDPLESNSSWIIPTLEGMMEALPGDWIIKGIQGEFYPCKPDIFDQTYEEVYE